jgi:hypothetical protein
MLRKLATGVLLLSCSGLVQAQSFEQILSGKRLSLIGGKGAGWEFKKDGVVLRYDQGSGATPTLKARVRWVSPDTFLLVETSRDSGTPGCPARVWCYKVDSIQGTTANLKEIWVGWNTFNDSAEVYAMTFKK